MRPSLAGACLRQRARASTLRRLAALDPRCPALRQPRRRLAAAEAEGQRDRDRPRLSSSVLSDSAFTAAAALAFAMSRCAVGDAARRQ